MAKQIKVLIVEDEEIISKALATKLGKNKFNITLAMDGATGLELAKKEMPDIVLLDLIMPKMSGFEVLEKIKKDPATNKIPVVILSNLDDSSYLKKGIEAGAAEYMVKTRTNLEEIIAKIHEIVKV
ncbi:response regulator [Patescibacteria group bacterium]|nr:response regulator [Patescibacteria group bacterium]MBU1890640.1 response regulator [Patescibacteria group bacterium]